MGLISLQCYGQSSIDSLMMIKLRAEVDAECLLLRDKMVKEGDHRGEPFIIEYVIDTLKIKNLQRKSHDIDYTTSGMYKATWLSYDEYDKLLNKYYKLLKNRLQPKDRKILQEAQRSWLKYRDKEIKLIATVYGYNDGTIQGLTRSAQMRRVVEDRVQYLFGYLLEIERY